MFWCQLLWANILLHQHQPWVPGASKRSTKSILDEDSVPHLREMSLFYPLTFSSVAYTEFLTSEMPTILVGIISVLHSYYLPLILQCLCFPLYYD